jgi:hypothetical protein
VDAALDLAAASRAHASAVYLEVLAQGEDAPQLEKPE